MAPILEADTGKLLRFAGVVAVTISLIVGWVYLTSDMPPFVMLGGLLLVLLVYRSLKNKPALRNKPALIACPVCKTNTSNRADRCPYCGHPIHRGFLGAVGSERALNVSCLIVVLVLGALTWVSCSALLTTL